MSVAPIDPHASDFVAAQSAAIPEAGRAGKNALRNAEIIAKRKAGIGPREIARQMRLTPNVVAGVLNRAGVSKPGRGGWAQRVPPEIRRQIAQAAASSTYREVATKFGVTPTTVFRFFQTPDA